MLGDESGYEKNHRVIFNSPRTADYRASVHDIANYMMDLMSDENLRRMMGEAGRARVVEHYDYRAVTRRFLQIVSEKLGIS
jgi:glycosyltransferase involved in cell wall biosynthesis